MQSAEDQASVLIQSEVSRETWLRLLAFKTAFDDWQKRINLVAPSTREAFWTRHVADSLQVIRFAPEAPLWADLGSGGGFPGLIAAAVRSDLPETQTILLESNHKKAAFLREAARLAGIRADIRAERLEAVLPKLKPRPDVLSARALAPLSQLVAWCAELLKTGTLGLYLKGRDASQEIEALGSHPGLRLQRFQSRTDPQSCVVAVWNPDRCQGPAIVSSG
jgi:16S rRNA (guanine527-N7)-methyltransferase